MRRFFQVLIGVLSMMAARPFGYTASWVGRNMIVNLSYPSGQRFSGYCVYGMTFRGWQMYAVPILCTLWFAAFACAGLLLVFRRRNA